MLLLHLLLLYCDQEVLHVFLNPNKALQCTVSAPRHLFRLKPHCGSLQCDTQGPALRKTF
eukprot:Gb_15036 [translate_table: standard]